MKRHVVCIMMMGGRIYIRTAPYKHMNYHTPSRRVKPKTAVSRHAGTQEPSTSMKQDTQHITLLVDAHINNASLYVIVYTIYEMALSSSGSTVKDLLAMRAPPAWDFSLGYSSRSIE